MTEEDYGFCPHCGANLKSDSIFCPDCGNQIYSENRNEYGEQELVVTASSNGDRLEGKMQIVFIGLILYVIASALTAISLISMAASYDAINDMIFQSMGKTLEELMSEVYGISMSKEEIVSTLMIYGILGLASAVTAGICAYFCNQRINWTYALILCIATTILSYFVFGYIGVVIGAIAVILLYLCKQEGQFVN